MNLRTALHKNGLASVWAKASSILFRLLQVPLLLAYLDVEQYGNWLMLSAFPAWLSLANFGFGSVASNQISLLLAADNHAEAQSVFSTNIALLSAIVGCGTLCLLPVALFTPWYQLLDLPPSQNNELAWAMVYMGLAVFLSFFSEVFVGRLRAARLNHHAILLTSVRPWLELAVLCLTLQFTKRFDMLGLAALLAVIGSVGLIAHASRRGLPTLRFSLSSVQRSQFWMLLRKGSAFQMIPLGQGLLGQGCLVVIHLMLGAAAVAIFATARTLVNSVHQIVETINQITWSELSHLLGLKDLQRVRRLHRSSVGLALVVSCLLSCVLAIWGHTILSVWTNGKVEMSRPLLLLFVLPVPLHAVWYASCVVILASNRHEGFALRYSVSALLALIVCACLATPMRISGAAISVLLFELLMLPYVLRQSLLITHDRPREFLFGAIRETRGLPAVIFGKRQQAPAP